GSMLDATTGKFFVQSLQGMMDGFCIGVSSDYGKTFTLDANHCVNVGTDRLDGGSMAAGSDGAVYFAAVSNTGQKVWVAHSATDSFTLLPGGDPFGGLPVRGHPRIRV